MLTLAGSCYGDIDAAAGDQSDAIVQFQRQISPLVEHGLQRGSAR